MLRFLRFLLMLFIGIHQISWKLTYANVDLLYFPNNNEVHAQIEDDLPDGAKILELTYCTWLKTAKNGTILLIHAINNTKRQIQVGVNVQQQFASAAVMDGNFFYTGLAGKMNKWFHFCFTWTVGGAPIPYIDGEEPSGLEDQKSTSKMPLAGGTFTIGNLLLKRSTGGVFSFHGEMYDTNLWNQVLTPSEIFELSCCRSQLEGDILTWSDMKDELTLFDGVEFREGEGPCSDAIDADRCQDRTIFALSTTPTIPTIKTTTKSVGKFPLPIPPIPNGIQCKGRMISNIKNHLQGSCCFGIRVFRFIKFLWCLPYFARN